MEPATGVGFSVAARRLAEEARRRGLVVPGFRSPPRLAGARRTLRRFAGDAPPLVSVERRGRLDAEVLADMVDGVVVANGLTGAAAESLRHELHAAVASVQARVA